MQISGYLEKLGWGGGGECHSSTRKLSGVTDLVIFLIVVMVLWGYIHMSNTPSCTPEVYASVCHYTSLKLFKNTKS